MRSRQLETALALFVEEAADRLQADLDAGAEVPFELDAHSARGHRAALYCYRPLTDDFIRERWQALRMLPSHAAAVRLLDGFEGLDRYLLARASNAPVGRGTHRRASRETASARTDSTLRLLLEDVFAEQSDFGRSPIAEHEERLQSALQRLDCSAHSSPMEVTLLATLHGLAISSPELALAAGLTIAKPEELSGIPDGALTPELGESGVAGGHLLVAFGAEDPDVHAALARGRDVLAELLRALRLFGDGRVTLGPLAWARIGSGAWSALPLGRGGRPHGMLLVSADQEDELRAFCNLVSRRAPREGELAWALARYEMGCERATEYEALSDYLLALRTLLEPAAEGPRAAGLLAPRLAALCATPGERKGLIRRVGKVLALERAAIAGTAVANDHGDEQVRELANYLRALLRDVICGHLDSNLVGLADELLAPAQEPVTEDAPVLVDAG
jgi:hypothetical protein